MIVPGRWLGSARLAHTLLASKQWHTLSRVHDEIGAVPSGMVEATRHRTVVKRKAERMDRFHDALQQLARRGYFAMEPNDPVVRDIRIPSDLNEQASAGSGLSHPIEIAAALPQLHLVAPPAEFPEVDNTAELFRLDHGDEQEMALFEPIVIDAGVRRWPWRTQSQSVKSEPSCAYRNACEPVVEEDEPIVAQLADVTPYRPVLDRWAVFPERQDDLSGQNDAREEPKTVEPTAVSGVAAVPSVAADRLADTPDSKEPAPAQVDPTRDQAAGATLFPPTEYEAEIAERLRTPCYSERIRKLSDEISSYVADGGPPVVLLVSLDADSQRAHAATALAFHQCHQRAVPTLLIDADIDSRQISREFHMAGAGFVEAISGQHPWSDSVRQTSSEKIRLLPCGTDIGFVSPDSEQEEFQQITQFADQWRERYGLVLIDGGLIDSPLVPVLTRASDATLVFVQLGKSRREEFAGAVERLEKAGGNIRGCITTRSAA